MRPGRQGPARLAEAARHAKAYRDNANGKHPIQYYFAQPRLVRKGRATISRPMDRAQFYSPQAGRRIEAPRHCEARFGIGDVVRHRLFDFRGVVFDVDPVFANSEEAYEAILKDLRPHRDQPLYHLLATDDDSS